GGCFYFPKNLDSIPSRTVPQNRNQSDKQIGMGAFHDTLAVCDMLKLSNSVPSSPLLRNRMGTTAVYPAEPQQV
ncbi:MAG: hypothetical protein PHR28_12065, partial [candidate division Zixibacteria bacterium]|nr:hypothetical protein [candidate division Zixibacteria bacterium]